MSTTDQNARAQGTKQSGTSDVHSFERTRDAEKKARKTPDAQREAVAKEEKERSDWEGMTVKPDQGEDDVAAPGELPETD